MKFYSAARAALLAVWLFASAASGARTKNIDRTITQVVKLLQNMLDKSKEDGDSERELFGKHKCYCDENEAAKKQEIADLSQEIGVLESDIEGLQADTAVLSTEVAQLDANMKKNVQDRQEATSLRSKENTDFLALEADLTDAISRMDDAIKVLSDIGADQSLGQAAADHQKFMANYQPATLLNLRKTVKQALVAASAVVSKKQSAAVEAFLQAPFTGTYTAQSGEVVGILKDMHDTFSSNLDDARAQEKAAVAAHNKYMDAMVQAHADMDTSYQSKQGSLSTNDGNLATKRGQLADAEKQKVDAETFLAELIQICTAKAKDYDDRVALRANEEAAIAEAISILNSDAAFEVFGTVTATKSGRVAFFQTRSVQRHRQAARGQEPERQEAQALLRKAAGKRHSVLLGRIVGMLQANNPFTVVLAEIDKMIDLLSAEEKADDDQLAWCNSERQTNNDNLAKKKTQINNLNGQIAALIKAIEAPGTGLKAMIQSDEDSLEANIKNQGTETKDRTADNLAYQKDVENLVEAQALLTKALEVLKAYYSKILGNGAFLAISRADPPKPAPPSTWDGTYKGQSGQGSSAISMLEFILQNTGKEEDAAHEAEKTAQHAYEDSMQLLKDGEATLESNLAQLRKSLAEKEEELLGKQKDLKATTDEKEAIEAYLEQIKPGCDFITTNIGDRKANRVIEEEALQNAKTLLKGTPAYQQAAASAHEESLGECLPKCQGDEAHAKCKACLAKVTVPAYCAGHAGTPGC